MGAQGSHAHPALCGTLDEVSAISAISVSPRRRRVALYSRFHRDRNIRFPEVLGFLRQLLRHLRGQVFLMWDSNQPHRAAAVRDFLLHHPRVHTYRFPGYAPELNPGEFVCNHLKRALANSAPTNLGELKQLIHPPLQRLRQSQRRLWACIFASDLPWP